MTIDQHTALFHRPTLVLCLANLSHFFAMTSLFSYVGFLVVAVEIGVFEIGINLCETNTSRDARSQRYL